MKRRFITYGDKRFEAAKARIVREAQATGEFDLVTAYGPEDLTDALRCSAVFSERRGGGLWSWKPDILATEMDKMQTGDIVVYADAGCEIVSGREWRKYWRILQAKEIIAQRIYQVNERWTRRSLAAAFTENPEDWLQHCQFMATVVMMRKTPLTVRIVDDWRRLMMEHPEMVRDVAQDERSGESERFIENRHDQAVFTALIYRELGCADSRSRIHIQWEHVENLDPFRSQVVRAMRWNRDEPIPFRRRLREKLLRIAKDMMRRPFYSMLERCHNLGVAS